MEKKKLLFFGDSITDMGRDRNGDGTPFNCGFGYVFLASANVNTKYPKQFDIINRGISGNRIVDLYSRIKSDVINLEPDVLTILIGVNDIWHEVAFKNGVDIERFEEVYTMMIEDVKKSLPNTKIIILEPFVLEGSATKEQYAEFLKVKDYAVIVKKVAKKQKAVFVPLQEKIDEVASKLGGENVLYDGVHPTPAGSKVICDEWFKAFEKNIIK